MKLEDRVRELLAEKKMEMLSTIAEDCGVTELQAARALPEDMRAFCGGDAFDVVWEGLTRWPTATFIMCHAGSVVEIKGRIPGGRHGGGYFNLESGAPLGGHIRSDRATDICFLSLPFMGLESHSVQFFGADGAVLFGVYVGREQRVLIPEAREGFFAMRAKLCKETV